MEKNLDEIDYVKKLKKETEEFTMRQNIMIKDALKYSQIDKIKTVDHHFSQITFPDDTFRNILKDINNQMDSIQYFINNLEKEVPESISKEFKYIEEHGITNGFAYTAYIPSDDQCKLIKDSLNDELSEEDIFSSIKDMKSDFEYRVMNRLENGKELAKFHFENVFNANPKLSIHYLVVLIEELLKCYNGFPSTNKLTSGKSRYKVRNSSTNMKDDMLKTIDSNYHSVELVKKSYDEVLIDQFYMPIDKENPSELPFVNRNDVIHVYSDMDRYSLLDAYKLLLIISNVLDLLEIMDIVKMEKEFYKEES